MAITIPSVTIDPVTGLVEYVLEVKPYHTKILEVLVEYIHTDCIDVTFEESFYLSLGQPAEDLLGLWGWDLAEAQKWFNCNYIFHQIVDVDIPGKTWTIYLDQTDYFSAGDEILVETDNNIQTKYTVSNVVVNGDGNTELTVVELIPLSATSKGVIVPATCWTFDADTGVYTYNVGIHWPPRKHVARNQDCGGYGFEYQDSFNWLPTESYLAGEQVQYFGNIYEADIDIPLGSPQEVPSVSANWSLVGTSIQAENPILSAESSTNSFVIDNNANVPVNFADWRAVFKYGVKFNVKFTPSNNGEYTVLFTTLNTTTQELTIYAIEDVSDDQTSPAGVINIRPFGYDEPSLCLKQGQSLAAAAHITEKLEFKYIDYFIISAKSFAFAGSPPGSPWTGTGSPFIQPPNTFLIKGLPVGSPTNLLPGSVLYVTNNSNEGYYRVASLKPDWDGKGNTLVYIDTVIGSPIPPQYNISIATDDVGGYIQIWNVSEEPVLEGIFIELHDTIGVVVGTESLVDNAEDNPYQSPQVGLAPTSWDANYWDVNGFDEDLDTLVKLYGE